MSQQTAGRVGENGDGSCRSSLLGELRAVMMGTRQCDIQVAGTYQPGVDGDAADNRAAQCGTIPQKFGQADLVSGARPNHAPP